MELEKEVRYLVSDDEWEKAIENSTPFKEKTKMLDITMGAYGRESVAKTGKVFRIRKKGDKITLEVKNRIEGGWQEEVVRLDSVEQGMNFLRLAGMEAYLFIDRYREVRKYKGLKVFFDDINLLGKYIELEYQDSDDAVSDVEEFKKLCGINSSEQPLYGDIINYKYENDENFRIEFERILESLIN